MIVKGVQFDRQRILHDIASLYTDYCLSLEYPNGIDNISPQEFARASIAIYCTMLGHLQEYDSNTLADFIKKEMP